MKKVLTYSLVVFYLLISIRLTANIHFCGGKLKTISFVGFSEQKRCCAGKPMKRGCCEDVKLCFKKSGEDERVSPVVLQLSPAIITEIGVAAVYAANPPAAADHIAPSIHPPPPDAFPPIYLKNCVFII